MVSLKKYVRNIRKNQHLLTSNHYFGIGETLIKSKDQKLFRETQKLLKGPNDSIGKLTLSLILNSNQRKEIIQEEISSISNQILTSNGDKLEYTRFRLMTRIFSLSDLKTNLNDTINDLNTVHWHSSVQKSAELLINEIFAKALDQDFIVFQDLSKLLLPYLFTNQNDFKLSLYNVYSGKKLEYLVKNYSKMDKSTFVVEATSLLEGFNDKNNESLNNLVKLALLLKDAGKMDINRVIDLFDGYLRTGFMPDREIFNLLMSEMGNDQVHSIPTSTDTGNSLAKIAETCPQLRCWEIFRSMERSGIPSNSESFALVFASCKHSKNKDKDFIFKVEEYLLQNSKTHSYRSLYNLIESLLVLGHYTEAFQRITDMETSDIPLTRDIYHMVLKISTRDKRLTQYMLKEFKREIADQPYDLLLECCRVSGDLVSALELVDEMALKKIDLKPYRNQIMELGEMGGSELMESFVEYLKK
ncbi:hypothetical protein HK103_001757 [Boothiomyces macroporosus]|uniref:Pentatricopeptide repeat-containing protein n=1 Tax=Boothiomyces macroporosus TaxID=261099 RepID=A0AAD5UJR6_9FUNG|nr:hypothetical protein HK103_001757 [Boothiomyces macroporosus]